MEGESAVTSHPGKIERVFLKPENARAYPAAVQAILQADLIVAGPGSFYTSVMPNLLVPAIRDAICASAAPRIYVCNVATQAGETDGYTVSDHMRQLRLHTGGAFETVLANDNLDTAFKGEWVRPPSPDEEIDYRLYHRRPGGRRPPVATRLGKAGAAAHGSVRRTGGAEQALSVRQLYSPRPCADSA